MSQDGFGIRTLGFAPENGDAVEVLSFSAPLAAVPAFAAATGERVARLTRVRHAMYARVRKLDRPSEEVLLLYSDHVAGWRLSDVLTVAERERWRLDISAVLALLRQLLPAVALFSRHQRDATIGTLGPERLILTPEGRLVIAEYVLAPGLEKMQYSRERLWREFRVSMPPTASPSKIPPSADVVGIGIVALSLLLGRLLRHDEYLVSLGEIIDGLTETSGDSTMRLSATFRSWLARALQFDAQTSFQTTQEAQVAFEELLAKERSYVTSSVHLNQFVINYERQVGHPPTPSVHVTPPIPVVPLAPVPPAPSATPVAHVAPVAPAAPVVPIAPVAPVVPAAAVVPVAPVVSEAPVAPLVRVVPDEDDLDSAAAPPDFTSPAPAAPVSSDSAAALPFWRRHALVAVLAVAVIEAFVIGWLLTRGGSVTQGQGELVVQSRPVAARVTIDGEERGITPFTTELSPGSHVVEIRVGRSEPRVIPLMIRAGVQTSLYVELQSVATVGGLEVRTDPPNARVTISGQDRGVTPLTLRDLPPGEIEVVVRLGRREVRQTVRIEPGITSQLVVPLAQ